MPSAETLSEIINSIRQNKVRTVLAGFGVAWGIFILVVLLGAGEGFRKGVMLMFSSFAQKSMYVYGGTTSQAYKNIGEGVPITFDDRYLAELQMRYSDEIRAISPQISTYSTVKNAERVETFNISGVSSAFFRVRLLEAKRGGRIFNLFDTQRKRNVAVIGENVANSLFGKKQALNKNVEIAGEYFQIVGIIKNDNIFSVSDVNSVYIHYDNYLRCFGYSLTFNSFCLLLNNDVNTTDFEQELKNYIAYKSNFDKEDSQALYVSNIEAQTSSFESLFNSINVVIWIVGLCFLLSGIVGICNVMLIIVKERTNEIGIRQAVGAEPHSIVSLIMAESVVITLSAGLVGILLGYGALQIIDLLIGALVSEQSIMSQTELNIPMVIFALWVLVLSGIAAGLFPAIKASRIMPVDAIRFENRG
ncbi:MAG: ABC transporter permease [Salinivirgaceae bacterium]|nr:ABC transporter permease [Salinivirgaceae bacterium]